MKRRFVIATGYSSTADQNAVTNYLTGRGLGWMHYLPDIWLVVDGNGTQSVNSLAEALRFVVGKTTHLLVLDADAKEQSLAGQTSEDAWKWIRENWVTPPSSTLLSFLNPTTPQTPPSSPLSLFDPQKAASQYTSLADILKRSQEKQGP